MKTGYSRHKASRWLALSVFLVIATLGWAPRVIPQTLGQAEQFSAAGIDINTGNTGRVDISVTRWSTAAERAAVVNALFGEGGQDELLKQLRDMRSVGRIYSPGSIGYELRYAQQRRLPDGEREILLATDRPMSFRELVNQPRSVDYPFTWVRLKMRPDGTGEGSLAVAARITGDKDDRLIEAESYSRQPVRLESVKSRTEN